MLSSLIKTIFSPFCITSLLNFIVIIIIILSGKTTHSIVMVLHTPVISIIISEVSITHLWRLCSTHYKSKTVQKASTFITKVAIRMALRARVNGDMPINYCQKSEVTIMLRCHLGSTCYTAVQTKTFLKSTTVIKETTMKNMDNFHYAKEAIMCTTKSTPFHCQQVWMEHKGGNW